jgi:glucose-6-phosphate 1-dehydrogenase
MFTSTDPISVVIFGASGDLTRRKLLPALYHLCHKERMSASVKIIGVSRRPYSHQEFREKMREGVEAFADDIYTPESWARFEQRLTYVPADVSKPEDMEKLRAHLEQLEGGEAKRLYYLSVAPFLYEPIIANLGQLNMAAEKDGWRRIVIEKPFGYDLQSAQELNKAVHAVFNEKQVYRIDHYLGKETAQNILFFRFANTIFEPVWKRNYVKSVQITVGESVDVGHRGGYYDNSGVLRDMFQNHLLQLLTLIAMEPPASFEADALRNEKVKVLKAVRPVLLRNTVRAQYDGYKDAEGVDPDSQTPTYAALRLRIDNWRWQGVPFYLRSGKALNQKVSEITIEFQNPPHVMFDIPPESGFTSNTISICIQPDEGIHLSFEAKVPDSAQNTRSVDMAFHYQDSFDELIIPEAYERLLLDALNGDAALFTRSDEIEAAWKIIDPILQGWQSDQAPPMATYKPGSWGPKEADDLLAKNDNAWRMGCLHDDDE